MSVGQLGFGWEKELEGGSRPRGRKKGRERRRKGPRTEVQPQDRESEMEDRWWDSRGERQRDTERGWDKERSWDPEEVEERGWDREEGVDWDLRRKQEWEEAGYWPTTTTHQQLEVRLSLFCKRLVLTGEL